MDAVEIEDVQVIVQTESDWLFRMNERDVWIPAAQVLDRDEWHARLRGRLVIPRSVAQDLRLV